MKDLLSRVGREVLGRFVESRLLLAFDYDGTLAPIVGRPELAAMRPRTRKLLRSVAALYPVVVVTGRSRADASARLRGVGVRRVIGNHGIEPSFATARLAGRVREWVRALRTLLADRDGIVIEDKTFSIAVHYRFSRRRPVARRAILEAAAVLGRVRILEGNLTVNILPVGAPHKGTALEQAWRDLGCDTALYIGDDETDEDVFTLDRPGRLLAIRVGRRRSSAADYFVPDQRAVDRLLEILIALRARVPEVRHGSRGGARTSGRG